MDCLACQCDSRFRELLLQQGGEALASCHRPFSNKRIFVSVPQELACPSDTPASLLQYSAQGARLEAALSISEPAHEDPPTRARADTFPTAAGGAAVRQEDDAEPATSMQRQDHAQVPLLPTHKAPSGFANFRRHASRSDAGRRHSHERGGPRRGIDAGRAGPGR